MGLHPIPKLELLQTIGDLNASCYTPQSTMWFVGNCGFFYGLFLREKDVMFGIHLESDFILQAAKTWPRQFCGTINFAQI